MAVDEAQGDLLTQEVSQTEATSWHSEENAEVVKQRGWKGGDDVIKSYRDLERDYSGRVKMPSPESSADEIRAFYQKTGCPENPEGYEIKDIPEGTPRDEGTENAIKQIAYDNGVSKQAFENIVRGYYEKFAADMQAGREAGERTLREELGDKYDVELTIGRRFCETCSDEFRNLLEQTGLGNNPVFIKEFIAKGKQILSDTLIKGSPVGGKEDFVPANINSPEMYATGEDENSKKARAYFEARGHKY